MLPLAAGMAVASLLRESNESLPALVARMAEIIEQSRQKLPAWLLDYVPSDADDLRKMTVHWLREHAQFFQVAGTGLGRALAHILLGMVIGGLLSLEAAIPASTRTSGSAADSASTFSNRRWRPSQFTNVPAFSAGGATGSTTSASSVT